MRAEATKAELNLPQAFLLLATNDQDGTPELPMYVLRTTLAGAILAELDLIGAIELQGKHVRATGTAPKTELQHELDLIRGKSRPHTPKRWASMLEGRAEMRRVYEGMASRGLVEHAGEKHLGLFRTVRYPERDHAPEAELLKKIEVALSGGTSDVGTGDSKASDTGVADATARDAVAQGTADPDAMAQDAGAPDATSPAPAKPDSKAPDTRTMALIALLQAAGLLGKLFPAADKSWADELAKDYWPARAVEDELLMIRLAQAEAPTL
ncbi:GPP34 family phosphoprotein [Arthrobacter sp. NPDC093125]|uniref:GOLPH3/VPS74 family protein n=1 Tax=Arthrobacter sp. NPDC093125 TaxID=3363944 RepID=UPI003820A0C9